MNWRPLADTLLDLSGAANTSREVAERVRVTRLSLAVPIEVRLRRTDDETVLLADVPLWRWQSGFEEQLGRLAIRMEEEPSL